jgi:two-component system chemotaxis sensor kinase CheA
MRDLAQFSSEGLALVRRADLELVSWNPLFLDLTSQGETSGTPTLSSILPANLLADLIATLDAGTRSWTRECAVKAKKGRPIPVRFNIEANENNSPDGLLVVRVTNETENKKRDLLMKSVGDMLDFNRKKIEDSKKNFKAMLDRLPQAFLTFDSEGVISQDCSARVEAIFGTGVPGREITELLPFQPTDMELLPLIFNGKGGRVLLDAWPREFHVAGKILEVAFTPIIEDQKMAMVMCAIADVTEYRSLREALDNNTKIAKTLYAILSSKGEFTDALDLVDSLRGSVEDPMEIRSRVHTLKGTFSFLECQDLAQLCHRWETEWRDKGYTSDSGRAFINSMQTEIDSFLAKHQGILKIHRGRGRFEITLEGERLLELYHRIQSSPLNDLSKVEILGSVETLLSPTIEETLGWLQKSWSEALSTSSKPDSQIVWQGSARIFPRPYKELFKSFVHIVRNAAAHGIESPDERLTSGKPAAGCLTISATLAGGSYTMSFTDDGGGIDSAKIREVANQRGLAVDPNLGAQALLKLIFEPEFSIQEDADSVSGRGLGLYIVQHEAKALNGDVQVHSQPGAGTTFTVTFPRLPIIATPR